MKSFRIAILALFTFVWPNVAFAAEPVTSQGFGETASSAITNAALNAVRDVAGSRITVNQELSTKTFAGIPDEIFIEKLLEVSRGTVSRLKVVSVEQVGDLYQATIQIEIDPGKLEIETVPIRLTPTPTISRVGFKRIGDGCGRSRPR